MILDGSLREASKRASEILANDGACAFTNNANSANGDSADQQEFDIFASTSNDEFGFNDEF